MDRQWNTRELVVDEQGNMSRRSITLNRTNMKRWKLILSAVVMIGIATATYTWFEFNREHADTFGIKPSFSKNAIELVKEFEDDEEASGKKYTDQVIAVKGSIIKIEKDDSTQKILLGERSSLGGVLCELDKRHKSQLENLQPGQPVEIKGVCTGMLMDVILTRCVLIEY
jgi:hypothetical protein